jgi:hypothetical protein
LKKNLFKVSKTFAPSPNSILGDQIKEDTMDRTCSTYGEDEKYTFFFSENLKERDHLEDLGVEVNVLF